MEQYHTWIRQIQEQKLSVLPLYIFHILWTYCMFHVPQKPLWPHIQIYEYREVFLTWKKACGYPWLQNMRVVIWAQYRGMMSPLPFVYQRCIWSLWQAEKHPMNHRKIRVHVENLYNTWWTAFGILRTLKKQLENARNHKVFLNETSTTRLHSGDTPKHLYIILFIALCVQ